MTADEVDEAVRYQRKPLLPIHEQFAHGQRSGRLLAHDFEPFDILGCEGVLEKEQPVRLEQASLLQSLSRRQPLVAIVQQFNIESELRTQVLEQLQAGIQVRCRLKNRRSLYTVRPRLLDLARCRARVAVTSKAGRSYL